MKQLLIKFKYYIKYVIIILNSKPGVIRTMRILAVIPIDYSHKLKMLEHVGYDISNINPKDHKTIDKLAEKFMEDRKFPKLS